MRQIDETLTVWMDGVPCGALHQTAGGNLTFEYDTDYRRLPNATPLSLSLPLSRTGVHPHSAVRPFLAGLLPDDIDALNALGARFGVSSRSPFALLRHVGADVAGALQILPAGEPSTDAERGGVLVPVAEDELERELVAVTREYRSGRPAPGLAQRISLAGAQPKLALHRGSDGVWYRPTGGHPTTHILKPIPQNGYDDLDLVEYLTMQAAGHLGITAADSELMQIGGSHVFVTRRYDRRIIDGRWHRIHQEDLCQALSVAPEKKYQRADGGPGVARIGQLFRALPQPVDRRVNAEAFFEGLMFNTIIQATDAHAKNYSLLLVGDRAVLAPLYDLITDAPYARAGQILQAAMAIGGEYSYPGIGRARALAAGRALGVDVDTASDVIERLSADVTAAFDEARRALPDHDLRRRAAHIVDAIANLTGPLRPAH